MAKVNGTRHHLEDFDTEVLVVGGGMGGVYALHRLRQEGYQVKLVEAGGYFGGVWYWNRYPGARVDSEIPLYTLNIPEVWNTFNYTARFPDHVELRRYFKHCDDVLQLSKDAIFNTIVNGVGRSGESWQCSIQGGGTITCKYLVLCTGSSHKQHIPQFDGLDSFTGHMVHAAAYPDAGIEVKGKRVGIIGNGATGIQLVQELGKKDCQLTVFIRTPIIALPMRQRSMTVEEQNAYKTFYNLLMNSCQSLGSPLNTWQKKFRDCNHEQRRAIFDQAWARGGFAFLTSTFPDFLTDKETNAYFYDYWKEKVRARITNEQKREIVAPMKQQHYLGVKRPSLEQDYYKVLDRSNVEVVSLKKHPIQRFVQRGIFTDKLHELDIIILATGYDSMTGSLMDLHIKDAYGIPLQEKWRDGVKTHLGLMIPGMPNMFMVYSPQAPTALTTGPAIIESQVEWIVNALHKMKRDGITQINAREESAEQWKEAIQEANERTLYPLEKTWYMGDNIPNKVREQLVYVKGLPSYNIEIAAALDTWQGFDLTKSSPETA